MDVSRFLIGGLFCPIITEDEAFTIQHRSSGKCLASGASADLILATCDLNSRSQLWLWGYKHQLFQLDTSLCLAFNLHAKTPSLVDCGSSLPLGWRCAADGSVYTVYQMGLVVSGGKVAAKRGSNDTWVRGGSQDIICHRQDLPVVHTSNGNSAGSPCDFPFKYNGSWHFGCLPDADFPGLSWCSTTSDYDQDGKKGHCLTPEEGCSTLFVGPEGEFCYEFVSGAAVTWHEALDSCRSQGADLLSLSEADDLNSTTRKTDRSLLMWIGLHQLDSSQGWQWSDGSPLSVSRWENGNFLYFFFSSVFLCKFIFRELICVNGKNCHCSTGKLERHGNSCYKVNTEQVSFKDHCNITIRNRFEQAFINRLLTEQIGKKTQHFWIGLQDIKNTGEYQWMSHYGNPGVVTYTNWGWFEPDQDGGCAAISTAKPLGKWEVKNCTLFKAGTICRKDLVPPPAPEPEPDPNATCPDGWVSRQNIGYCYKVFQEERLSRKRSWEEAKRFCQALGANLPSFTNNDEMRALHSIMRETVSDNRYIWVGLNRRNPADRSWQWSDGRPVRKTPKTPEWYNPVGHHETSVFIDGAEFWFVEEPKLSFEEAVLFCKGNGSKLAAPLSSTAAAKIHQQLEKVNDRKLMDLCAYMINNPSSDMLGTWDYSSCTEYQNLAICQHYAVEEPHVSTEPFQVNNHTIQLLVKNLTWFEALEQCRSNNMDLASVADTLLQSTLTVHVSRAQKPMWIGLFSDDDGNHYRWTDHSHTVFSRWPSEVSTSGSCVYLDTDGYWKATECDKELGGAICHKPLSESMYNQTKWYDGTNVQYSNWARGRPDVDGPFMAGLTTDGTWILVTNRKLHWEFKQKTIVTCKLDYEPKQEYNKSSKDFQHYGSLTYEVLTQKLTWQKALEECDRRGGHLASIHDLQHNAHLKLIAKTDGFELWIGLSNHNVSGSAYEWSDGTKFDYNHTITDAPKSSIPNEQEASCVYITPAGTWVRTSCKTVVDGAICYTTAITTPSQSKTLTSFPYKSNGVSQWIQHQDHCYAFDESFYNYSLYSMEQAKTICQKIDAELLTIKSKEENDFLAKYMSENPLISNRVWLGVDLDDQGKPVSWQDGSALAFANWKSEDQLKEKKSEPHCAVMMATDNGTWSLVNCKSGSSRVVCKTGASEYLNDIEARTQHSGGMVWGLFSCQEKDVIMDTTLYGVADFLVSVALQIRLALFTVEMFLECLWNPPVSH
uniref:Lymphocyte antigen 75 n=1 Tax=Amphiprion ocellaris TaxID=80972 RepID=A0AAQ6AGC7_AMPOC